jgi:hypothetical protein
LPGSTKHSISGPSTCPTPSDLDLLRYNGLGLLLDGRRRSYPLTYDGLNQNDMFRVLQPPRSGQ